MLFLSLVIAFGCMLVNIHHLFLKLEKKRWMDLPHLPNHARVQLHRELLKSDGSCNTQDIFQANILG